MEARATYLVGVWSAIAVALHFGAFGVLLVVGFWMPTAMLSYGVCLAAAPFFVAMMASLALQAGPERRIWGALAVAFAVAYSVLIGTTYFLQLALFAAGGDALSPEATRLLAFAPGSVTFALDMLGYGFMTLATLAGAGVFVGGGLSAWLRWWFVAHGALVVPTLLAPMLMGGADAGPDALGSLVLIGWVLVFVPLAVLVAVYCRRALAGEPIAREARVAVSSPA